MSTIVTTQYGKLEGYKEENVYVWKGIPYAASPINSLRFYPPQSPEPWDGIREAKKFSPAAMQPPRKAMQFLRDSPTNISEDCLYLNVWSPGADDKRRPVMVWIHGGSFIAGSGSSILYDGHSFAEDGDVVVVTINYRLGIFGFLHLGGLEDEKYAESRNCGLLDQVAALKWVQENIESFGGDPKRVTIFGESAGALSVGSILAMPSAKGLFSQAILQSGAARLRLDQEKANEVANEVLSELGIKKNELFKLEKIPAETLLKVANNLPPLSLAPVTDGVTIPVYPEKALNDGIAKDIPILIGTTLDEWRLFTFFDDGWKDIDEKNLLNVFEQTFGSLWPKISEGLSEHEVLNRTLYEELMTHYVFTYPAIYLSECQVKQDTPVWMYRFDYQSTAFDGELKYFSCTGNSFRLEKHSES